MGMHPKFEYENFFILSDLIFSEDKKAVFQRMRDLDLVDEFSIERWLALLPAPQPEDCRFVKLIDRLKLSVDPLIVDNGYMSISSPWAILKNIVAAMRIFDENFLSFENIRNLTALDFGSGIYRPLSVAIILFVNGFKGVQAFEPFAPKVDFSYLSCIEVASQIMQYPEKYNFSGIDESDMIANLARLNFRNIREKFSDLAAGRTTVVDMGGVRLVNDLGAIPDDSIDFQFSNAVLEHVPHFFNHMLLLWAKMSSRGIALHTVDYLDHRYYDNYSLHPFEKYYDGVLDEINGMLPSEMEAEFMAVGFNVKKIVAQMVPESYFSVKRKLTGKYKSVSLDELRQHINMYYLTKM